MESRTVGALVNHNVRWSDFASPKDVIGFTLSDAWQSLPTLLAMAGFFLVGIFVLVIAKKLLQWLFLGSYVHRYILERVLKSSSSARKPVTYWMKAPFHNYGTMIHLLITSMFLLGIGVLGIFTASIGGINIWSSPLASVGIGLNGTYIFGIGLQQVGSYYFVLWFGGMSYGEYWRLVQSPVEGRVSRITPFFIELESLDPNTTACRMFRISMTTVLNGHWERDYHKEIHEPKVSRYDLPSDAHRDSGKELPV
jgi:hypothetical protein